MFRHYRKATVVRIAVEVKASRKVSLRDARGLLVLKEEKAAKRFFLVSEDPIAARPRRYDSCPRKSSA